MTSKSGTLRTCENGHRYYKSSSCPVCPICEKNRIPEQDFLADLSAPARRALENEGINSVEKLSTYSSKELLQLHGFGKSSIPALQRTLDKEGLKFNKDEDS